MVVVTADMPVNPFIIEFLKWTLPSLNLDTSIVGILKIFHIVVPVSKQKAIRTCIRTHCSRNMCLK